MKFTFKYAYLFLLLGSTCFAQQKMPTIAVEPGVSLALANDRGAAISNIQYQLHFIIPAEQNTLIDGIRKVLILS